MASVIIYTNVEVATRLFHRHHTINTAQSLSAEHVVAYVAPQTSTLGT